MIPGKDELLFLPLGGAGEIGMNLNLYGHAGKWLAIDCGVTFGDDTLDIARFRTSDRVHPISYDEIAAVLLPRGQPRGSRKSTVEWSQRSRR